MGEYGQTSLISVAVISLLTAQERRSEPTQSGEATMSFRNGMKQPLADLQLLQPETKETASEPFPWHTSEDLKQVRGRCTTGAYTKIPYDKLLFSL